MNGRNWILLTVFLAQAALAQQQPMPGHMHEQMQAMAPAGGTGAEDTRQLLKLSPETTEALRADMRHMMKTLGDVLAQLAAGDRDKAAKTLEEGLGITAMSTHPGMMKAAKEMPDGARMLGMGMHQAASQLAASIKSAEPARVFAGLQQISAGCASCHAAYRVR